MKEIILNLNNLSIALIIQLEMETKSFFNT